MCDSFKPFVFCFFEAPCSFHSMCWSWVPACLIGEVVSIPLPRTITSIWSLPFGLLFQQSAEVNSPAHIPFSSSSPPLLGTRDIPRHRREFGHSPQHNFGFLSSCDNSFNGDTSLMCSHLILKDPLEEPQVCCFNPLINNFIEFLFSLLFCLLQTCNNRFVASSWRLVFVYELLGLVWIAMSSKLIPFYLKI